MALVFKVRKSEAELVKPAKATPNEVKSLSDWDDRVILRDWMSGISFYNSVTGSMLGDPAEIIKRAVAEALVYYYPIAGRFKEQEKRLVVDCNAEGVSFVSADADVRLDQFGLIRPPFPCLEELLSNKPADPTSTLSCPIAAVQVTRLACGGFILAFAMNHVMGDVVGAFQFVTAFCELAAGAPSPRVRPVWGRELLNARSASPSCNAVQLLTQSEDHADHDQGSLKRPQEGSRQFQLSEDQVSLIIYRSFFFGAQELDAIRAHLPDQADRFTTFELISACVLHCRVVSIEHAPEEKVCAIMTINARSKLVAPALPPGYYGNCSFPTYIVCPMKNFHDLQYVVEEVKKAKDGVTEEYVRSYIEADVVRRRSGVHRFAFNCPTYIISDLSSAGMSNVESGRGQPVYTGATNEINIARPVIHIVGSTNDRGEHGRLVTLYMPEGDMDKFEHTLHTLLGSV